MTVAEKKARFFCLLVPPVQKIYDELTKKYNQVSDDINNSKNKIYIQKLKKSYKVSTDEELLIALKPHPKSIVLAQAALESGWATSRFFIEANNVFGMWSANESQSRIVALKKRGKKTIWLRKFDTVEDSIRAYYKTIATVRAYREFRDLRYSCNNVFVLVEKLDKYSERGKEYTKELSEVIKHNNLTKYDR